MKQNEIHAEALTRAQTGQSMTNYPDIFRGFLDKGISIEEIKPRENVLTFNAWKALGRTVKKGEHGVKVFTFVKAKNKDSGEEYSRPHATTVFHISQTNPLN
jgi:hypothetical protein